MAEKDENIEEKELEERRLSTSSSRGSSVGSDWTLLNAQGSEIENSGCQTSAKLLNQEQEDAKSQVSVSSLETSEFDRLTPAATDSEDNAVEEEIEHEADVSRSTIGPEVSQERLEEPEIDDLHIVDEQELEEIPKMYIDAAQVARLLDALVERHNPVHQLDDGSFCDDLPVNFVEKCSNRIRNYVHTRNSRVNWTITFVLIIATAVVLGLGVGHFIGSTHSWIKRHRLQNEQLKHLKSLQDDLVTCLDKAKATEEQFLSEITDLRHKLAGFEQSEISCHVVDKPSCVIEKQWLSDVKTDLSQCKKELITSRESMNSKAAINRWLLDRKRHESTRNNFISIALAHSKNARRRTEKKLNIITQLYEKQTSDFFNLKQERDDLTSQEASLRQIIAQFEGTNQHLKASLLESEKEARNSRYDLAKCQRKMDRQSRDDPMNVVYEMLDKLKMGGNLSDTLLGYLAIVQKIKLPEMSQENGEKFAQQLKNLNGLFGDLKNSVKDQLKEVEKFASTHKIDEIAKDLKEQMTTTLSKVWEQTKETAQSVQNDHSETISYFMQHIRDVKSIVENTVLNGFGLNEFDDDSEIFAEPDLADDDEPSNQPDLSTPHCYREAEPEPFSEPKPSIEPVQKPSEPDPPVYCFPKSRYYSNEKTRSNVLRFRTDLKRSSLEDFVGEKNCDHYLARLKFLTKLSQIDEANLAWWICQQKWWNGLSTSKCRYMPKWQINEQSELRRKILNDNYFLKKTVHSWIDELESEDEGFCEEPDQMPNTESDRFPDTERSPLPSQSAYGPWPRPLVLDEDDDWSNKVRSNSKWMFKRAKGRHQHREEEHKADWLFERSKDRDTYRKEGERGYEKARWVFKRGKDRAHHRETKWKHRKANLFAKAASFFHF